MSAIPSAPPLPDLPPSYEASRHDDLGPPPSYDSLFGEFRQVDSAKGLAYFLRKAFKAITDTLAAAVVLAFLNVIPLGMIVIGAINVHNCPLDENIPRWLLITGVLTLLRSALNFAFRFQQRVERPKWVQLLESLLSISMLVWFVLGTVWVFVAYSNWKPTKPDSPEYCDQFTYVFSFVFLALSYALLGLACMCFCCCCCCVCCRGASQGSHPPV